MGDRGYSSSGYRRMMKEIRRLKERLRGYAKYVLDLLGDLDDSRDLVEQVREGLEKMVDEESHVLPEVITLAGESYGAKEILEFIRGAPATQIEMFREILRKELSRRRSLWRDIERIEKAVEGYVKELGVYMPFEILKYDRFCFRDGECHYMFKVEVGSRRYLDEFEGTLEDLIELFKEVVAIEAENISRLISKARRERSRVARELRGFEDLMREIERYVYDNAILAISGDKLARPGSWRGMPDEVIEGLNMGLKKAGKIEIVNWDATRIGKDLVVYGANPGLWPEFYPWFRDSLSKSRVITILLRSFKKEIDEASGLPIKEIRGYIVYFEDNGIRYYQLSAKELLEAYTKDPETGERIEPEPAVIFCGPNNEMIYSVTSYKEDPNKADRAISGH
ncbi:MAG: hypothetical protein RQ885_07615 [Desulfurococcales archaeon]|jgi:hypothetical protein|nr:hypothetical protein [Desulfurococcales archaeon]